MYTPGAERSPPLFASPDAPPACASPRSECRGVLDVLGTLRSSRGERLTAVPPCARSGSPKAEPGDPHAAASMRAPRWRLSVLAKAMRGVRWLFFFRAAGVALAWLAGTPWEPSRAGRRIFSRAFRTFLSMIDEMMMCDLYGFEIPPCELSVLACACSMYVCECAGSLVAVCPVARGLV